MGDLIDISGQVIPTGPVSLTLCIPMRPVAWARPGGKTRYDTQTHEKAVFTSLALSYLAGKNPEDSILKKYRLPLFAEGTPLSVTMLFTFRDDRKVITSKSSDTRLPFPIPDTCNLYKFAEDALQSQGLKGVIWFDDRDVVQLNAKKRYGERDEITISIKRIPTQ